MLGTSPLPDIVWDNPLQAYNLLENTLIEKGYKVSSEPASIHGNSNINFSKNILKADSFVMNILENGLKLNFNSEPPKYHEKNNKSARDNMASVRAKVKEWEENGSVKKVSEIPHCVNPLSFVSKVDNTGKVKERVVLDQSRGPNLHIIDEKCKLDDLSQCEKLLEFGDYMCILDLENMFFHVHLAEDYQKYFGFSIPDIDGNPVFYVFLVLAFGCKPAVNIVTRIIKPVKALAHQLGIRFTIYVDDGRVLGNSSDDCWYKFKSVLLLLQLQGWNIQWKKTSNEPSQRLKYLGFITDTLEMKYYCDESKLNDIASLLSDTILKIKEGHSFSARELAQVLGKIQSISTSHGNVVLMCRTAQQSLGLAVFSEGWDSILYLDNRAVTEFNYILKNLRYFNGRIIANAPGANLVLEHSAILKAESRIKSEEIIDEPVFVSDASADTAYVFAKNDVQIVQDFVFTENERNYSSGHRELLAILKTLQSNLDFFAKFKGQTVYWQTDSQNTVSFLKKGSRKSKIQSDVLNVKMLERLVDIKIHPVWTPRSHIDIKMADRGSKLHLSTDEFSIDAKDLQMALDFLDAKPTVDCMASSSNFKFDIYYSLIPQNGSSGVNFYAQHLNPLLCYYVCPPVKDIVPVIRKFCACAQFDVVLIVPVWPSAVFWSFLQNGSSFRHEIVKVFYFKPKITARTEKLTIFEKGNFDFVAVRMKKSA